MRRRWALLIVAAVLARGTAAQARELPLRFFTTADGLGDNRVKRILLDSRGLLWVGTNSGISRFDGSQFQSFGVADGLPFPIINDLLETPEGDLWLASNGGGVIRVRLAAAGPRFESFSVSGAPTSNRVNKFYRAGDGTVWAGTDGGLFRISSSQERLVFDRVGLKRAQPDESVQVWTFANDSENTLWVGTRFGLLRLLPDGRIVSHPLRQGVETDHVFSLLYTPEDGLLWVGHESGLAIFKPPPASSYGGVGTTPQPAEDRERRRPTAARCSPARQYCRQRTATPSTSSLRNCTTSSRCPISYAHGPAASGLSRAARSWNTPRGASSITTTSVFARPWPMVRKIAKAICGWQRRRPA
jgi:ligand-binding sensor domain-containing protein